MTMYEAICLAAKKNPKKPAIIYGEDFIDFQTFVDSINHFSFVLNELGLRKDDVITIALSNIPEALIALYAANRIGVIVAMVHPLSTDNELDQYLEISKSKVLICTKHFWDSNTDVIKNKLKTVILIDNIEATKNIFSKLKISLGKPKIYYWSDLIKRNGKTFDRFIGINEASEYPAIILYSGGTTGTSKGVLHSNNAFNFVAEQLAQVIEMENEIVLAALPIFHGYGLCVCVHFPLYFGHTIVLLQNISRKSIAYAIKNNVTFLAGVPAMFDTMADEEALNTESFKNVKHVFSGGDKLTLATRKKFETFLANHGSNAKIREGYGLAETVAVATLSNKDICFEQSGIGKALPDIQIKVIDPESKCEVKQGEIGEITISGQSVMIEYIHDKESTMRVIEQDKDGMRWVHTGDLGTINERGCLLYKGRIKRMIVSNGYNIYPNQVEQILNEYCYIEQSCVVGISDKSKGEKIKAYIVLRESVDKTQITENNIRNYCHKKMAAFSIPDEIEFIDEIPKTRLGKNDYRTLQKGF